MELLGTTDLPACVQPAPCEFFSDVLVLVHLNPQRLEWIDALIEYASLFIPHLAFISLIEPRKTRSCSGLPKGAIDCASEFLPQAQRNALVDYLYLGPRGIKVHLVDSRMQIHGDHHDIATAMRLWPQFRGVMSWEHEDSLLSLWRFPRLNKDRVWRQPHHVRWPKGKRKSIYVGRVPDWEKVVPAINKIRNVSREDAERVTPQYAPGCSVYYIPMKYRGKVLRYSPWLLEVDGYNEVASPVLLSAVAEKPAELLQGMDIVAAHLLPARHKYPELFRPHQHDYLHPARACSELWARLTVVAQRVVLPFSWSADDSGFWADCFTCDEYPGHWWPRKGRFHNCKPGCTPGAGVGSTNRTSWNGLVQKRRINSYAPGELEHEGYWDFKFLQKVFQRYIEVNGTRAWPPARPT